MRVRTTRLDSVAYPNFHHFQQVLNAPTIWFRWVTAVKGKLEAYVRVAKSPKAVALPHAVPPLC